MPALRRPGNAGRDLRPHGRRGRRRRRRRPRRQTAAGVTGGGRPWARGAAAALVTTLMAGACGTGRSRPGSGARPALSGSLTVFAAASLTEAFDQEKATLASGDPHLRLTYSFAG